MLTLEAINAERARRGLPPVDGFGPVGPVGPMGPQGGGFTPPPDNGLPDFGPSAYDRTNAYQPTAQPDPLAARLTGESPTAYTAGLLGGGFMPNSTLLNDVNPDAPWWARAATGAADISGLLALGGGLPATLREAGAVAKGLGAFGAGQQATHYGLNAASDALPDTGFGGKVKAVINDPLARLAAETVGGVGGIKLGARIPIANGEPAGIDSTKLTEEQMRQSIRRGAVSGREGSRPGVVPPPGEPLSPAAALPDVPAARPPGAVQPEIGPSGERVPPDGAIPPEPPRPATPDGSQPIERGNAGILDALARKQQALHVPDNPILGPEGSFRRRVLAPIYNPSANMPREVHVANNARVSVESSLYGDFNRTEQAAARAAQDAFATTPPTYAGAVKNKVTGTAADYLERPAQYSNVSPALEAAKQQWGDTQLANRNVARGQYNADVGEYVQKDPQGVYVPHTQSADTVDQAVQSVQSSLASKSGVAKTRGYDTLFDRVQARADFTPETDLRVLADRHARSLASLSARETFKAGVGGLDKMQVLEATHPALAARVTALRANIARLQGDRRILSQQVADAIDAFVASPKEAADAASLQAALDLQPGRYVAKARAGVEDAQIVQNIRELKARLRGLQPALKSADTGDYVLNRDTFKYMKQPVSDAVSSVLKTSVNNAFIEGALVVADELRAHQLGPDFSPLFIQGTIGAMSHPEVPFQNASGLARVAISADALHTLVDPAVVSRYEFATGRSFGHAGAEFRQEGKGLERLPLIGGTISKFNRALERMVEYGTLKAWENDSALLQKFGSPENVADHEAANSISKFVPRLNPAETGKSTQRARFERLPLISSSFRLAPISLAKDIATASGKLAVHVGNPSAAWDSLTGREQLALLRGASFAATWATMSIGSAVLSAEQNNEDVATKVMSVVDPNSGRFGNILIGDTGGFGIGGPMRTTIRGLWPVSVTAKNGVEVLPHFWNLARGSASNMISTPIGLIRNADYSGKQILTATSQAGRIAQAFEYGLEQSNLVVGAALQDIRHGRPQDILGDVASQFAGVNYYDTQNSTPPGNPIGPTGPQRPSRPPAPMRQAQPSRPSR